MVDYAKGRGEREGQQLGNYHLIRLLGQGGFADVYLGEHQLLKTQAALKVLRVQLTDGALQEFLKEAQVIAHLEHPHIVRVLECGLEERTPFLVMSYAPNGTLRQRYPKGSRLQAEEVLSYVRQIASALDYAHQEKLIHRDIKPENLLLGRTNEVLVSDFGLVILAQTTGSQTTREMAGTIPYMAPEQLQGKPRAASDQYALGIIVYEWLSGERPFQGTFTEIASQHLLAPPPPLYGRIQGASPAIEQVVFKALAKNPRDRFPNMQEFAAAFEQASKAQQGSLSAPPLTPIPPGVPSQSTDDMSLSSPAKSVRANTSMHRLSQPAQIVNPSGTPPVEVSIQQNQASTVTPSGLASQSTASNRPLNWPSQPIALKESFSDISARPTELLTQSIPPSEPSEPSKTVVAPPASPSSRRRISRRSLIAGLAGLGAIGVVTYLSLPHSIRSMSHPISTPSPISSSAVPRGKTPSPRPSHSPGVTPTPTATSTPPQLSVNPTTLTLTGTLGRSNPATQRVMLRNTGGAGSWSAQTDANWLRTNTTSGALGGNTDIVNVDVSGTITGLSAGSYTGHVTFKAGSSTVGVTVTLIVQSPPPGTVWTAQNSQTSQVLLSVAWSGSQFVAVGNAGTILTSPEGRTWTTQNSGTSSDFYDIAWFGGQFMAVGSGETILTSSDGSTWTIQNSGTYQTLLKITWSGSLFVAVGDAGTILTSPDGSTWTTQNSGTSQMLEGVTWSGSQFVVVGRNGTILTSPDGSTWTTQQSGASLDFYNIVWSGSQFVVVGSYGTILVSGDGNTWTTHSFSTLHSLAGVTWSGSQFVAVGGGGLILTSPDASTWTAQNSGTSRYLLKVTWSGSLFVAVGDAGTILTSS